MTRNLSSDFPGRVLDRRHDVRIGAAAADVAAHELADLGVAADAALRDEADGRHDLARGAVAALEGVVVDEGLLHGMSSLPFARPSIVVISRPATMTASVRQALWRRPSTSTVQAPQAPMSQPFLVPVRSRRSRRRSSRVVRGSTVSTWDAPLMRNVRLWSDGPIGPAAGTGCATAAVSDPMAASIPPARHVLSTNSRRVRSGITTHSPRPVPRTFPRPACTIISMGM